MAARLHLYGRVCVFFILLSTDLRANETLRLDSIDASAAPRVTARLTYLTNDGAVYQGLPQETLKLTGDELPERVDAISLKSFAATGQTLALIVVAQQAPQINEVFEHERSGIRRLVSALAPNSQVAIVGYASDVKKYSEQLVAPADVDYAVATMAVQEDSAAEMHLVDAVKAAMALLATSKSQRKMIVVFSDGFDADMEDRIFSTVGQNALSGHIVIDAVEYAPNDASKLKYLSQMARQSGGSARVCKKPEYIIRRFDDVIDEIKAQYVIEFEVPRRLCDGRMHEFHIEIDSEGKQRSTKNSVIVKLPRRPPPIVWLWVLVLPPTIIVLAVGAWLMLRRRPDEHADELTPSVNGAPVPPSPIEARELTLPVSRRTRETLAEAGSSGAPVVAWLYLHRDEARGRTFRLVSVRTVIGAADDCDLTVEDDLLSAHHCEVIADRGIFRLRDRNSKNGVHINGVKKLDHELIDNDCFRIGRTMFHFKSTH